MRLVGGLLALGVVMGLGMALVIWTAWPGPRWLERWSNENAGFGPWASWHPGMAYARGAWSSPRPLKAHVVRLDLHDPGLELVVSARTATPDGFRSAWASGLLRQDGLLAAINATPFKPEPYVPGPVVHTQGLVFTGGWAVGDPVSNLDALVRSRTGAWSLQRGQTVDPQIDLGLGGFLANLRSGQNLGEMRPRDAVTAVGLSADRRWMYWLVVDGGQPGYSEGTTPFEAGEMLLKLGATDAILLDGGASTTLVSAGGWRGVKVMNRPRSPWVTGLQRPIACALGVRTKAPAR
ncbi:MAG: phosphodiester glycosidase family protein [Verrucomicrobiales bacterium]|nr:phosphodiester glycosidase family protein [Verrucomicrobiales bacterium]